MKKLRLGLALLAIVFSSSAHAAAGITDDFSVDSSASYSVDRYPVDTMAVSGGLLYLTISGADALNERPAPFNDPFYNWQGIQRSVSGVSGDWTFTGRIEVPAGAGDYNVNYMIRNGAIGTEDTESVSYHAIGFSSSLNAFYAWDPDVVAHPFRPLSTPLAPGWYTLGMKFTGGVGIQFFVDTDAVIDDPSQYTDATYLPNTGEATTLFVNAYNNLALEDTDTFRFDDINLGVPSYFSFGFQPAFEPVPEPSTYVGAIALLGLVASRFRKKR